MSVDFKVIALNDAGFPNRFGGDDLDKINRILNGEDLSLTILIDNKFIFNSGKLQLHDTSKNNVISLITSEENADWAITIPILGGNREILFTDLNQEITNKDINGNNNNITNIPASALPNETVLINKTNTYGSGAVQRFREFNIQFANPAVSQWYRWRTSEITTTIDIILPLLTDNDEFVFKNHPVEVTNKIQSAKSNTFDYVRKYQNLEAYGNVTLNAYDVEGDGHFNGIQTYGDIQAADNDAFGYWVRLLSKAAAGEFTGLAHFSDINNSFRRDKQGWIMGKMQTFSSDHPFTNQRFVFGFYDQRTLPPDSDTLITTTQHGFFIAFRSGVDTNYRILHNDGGGAAMDNDDSGLAFPTTSTIHEFEIRLGASSIDWFIKSFNGTLLASGNVTTKIPSTSQKLYFYFGMQGNAKSILLRNAECKTGGH